jgi:DNA/RNA-binding domain of Phe-tRNA-synthetase-like protein
VRAAKDLAARIALGLLSATGLTVRPAGESLRQALAAAAAEAADRYGALGSFGAIPGVKDVRAFFSALGIDPTRTRPSSEALLRRVLQGKGLPLVNHVVDTVNLCSLRALLPMGLYDRTAIRGEVRLELGRAGAGYVGLGKEHVSLEGRPALFDDEGPFGAPTSDSFRTRVHEGTTEILCVVFAPRLAGGEPHPALAGALADLRTELIAHCGAQSVLVCLAIEDSPSSGVKR